MLFSHMYRVLRGPEPLYNFRRIFAQQWAFNCLLQYVLSTMERTPGRVVFTEGSGRVLSPEFRTSYGNQGYMEKVQLPFRLTSNIVTLIGPFLLEGRFIPVMGIAASAINAKKDDMEQGMAQDLLGCEVAAEVDHSDSVFGIVTNYIQWNFLRSLDEKIEMEECAMDITGDGLVQTSLLKITSKIYAMLSDD